MEHYRVIVIGSGGGAKIAQSLQKLGIRGALIERDRAGGTCLNRGCIPSKMLIYPSGVMPLLKKLRGLKVSAGLEHIDFEGLVGSIAAYTDGTSDGISETFEKAEHIDYYRGEARFAADRVIEIGGRRITADRIVIATGSRPFIPDIPGLAETPYMTSTEALRNRSLPRRLIVLGGGFIACELGGAYAGFGSEVRFIVRSRLLRLEDDDILDDFRSAFDHDKIIHEHTAVRRAGHDGNLFRVLIADGDGREQTVEAEALLVATGVVPNADRLGLENTGIERREDGFIRVNDHLETTVPGVFAIGDVAGNFLYRHSVNFEAEYWVEANLIADRPFPVSYPPMPGAVFTHPEIASVGLTEREAREAGRDLIIGRAPYPSCTMAVARGLGHGLVKLIFDAGDHRLIGAHITGEEASTMIQETVLACTRGMTGPDMYRQIYIHPAFPEVIRNAMRDALRQMDPKYRVLF